MRILVTGGTGFIGSNLVLELMKENHDLLITGHDAEFKIPNFQGKYLQPSFLGIDFEVIGKLDVLFHQAAINDTTFLDRNEMIRANYESSKKLFEYVISKGCKRIVYASSTAVYGNLPAPYKENGQVNPLNPYAESKVLLDELAVKLAKEHTDVTIVGLRYCNVYGKNEKYKDKRATMIYQLAQQMLKGNPRIFESGEQKRDYIYVKDVVQANLDASRAKKSCIVNCGYGEATSFNKIIELLNKVLKLNRTPEYIKNPYGEEYQSYTECDMTLAKEKIGFVPKYDIESGIKDYYEIGELVGRN